LDEKHDFFMLFYIFCLLNMPIVKPSKRTVEIPPTGDQLNYTDTPRLPTHRKFSFREYSWASAILIVGIFKSGTTVITNSQKNKMATNISQPLINPPHSRPLFIYFLNLNYKKKSVLPVSYDIKCY